MAREAGFTKRGGGSGFESEPQGIEQLFTVYILSPYCKQRVKRADDMADKGTPPSIIIHRLEFELKVKPGLDIYLKEAD